MSEQKGFKSRKFLISLAAFLGSLGTSITGLAMDNEVVAIVGAVCAAVSAAIYAAVEAYVDGKAVQAAANSSIPTVSDEAK